jgi:hypothetical protein
VDCYSLAEWTARMGEQRITGVCHAAGPARSMTTEQMLEGIAQGVRVDRKLVWAAAAFLQENKVSAWTFQPRLDILPPPQRLLWSKLERKGAGAQARDCIDIDALIRHGIDLPQVLAATATAVAGAGAAAGCRQTQLTAQAAMSKLPWMAAPAGTIMPVSTRRAA